jgi:acyl carrier protein
MSKEQIRSAVLRVLGTIAPEADLAAVDPASNFREQIDLDSIDFVNFVIALADELGVEVPEMDYPKLLTLDDCVAYLESRVKSKAATP